MKKKLFTIILMCFIFVSCNSTYNDYERHFIGYFLILPNSKDSIVVSYHDKDTIFVYDSVMKYYGKMEDTKKLVRNKTLLLKVFLRMTDFEKVIDTYNQDNLQKNNSIAQELMVSIALDKIGEKKLSVKHLDHSMKLIEKQVNSDFIPFYSNYISFLKTKNLVKFKKEINSAKTNPFYEGHDNKIMWINEEIHTYDQFIRYISNSYDSEFLPLLD